MRIFGHPIQHIALVGLLVWGFCVTASPWCWFFAAALIAHANWYEWTAPYLPADPRRSDPTIDWEQERERETDRRVDAALAARDAEKRLRA